MEATQRNKGLAIQKQISIKNRTRVLTFEVYSQKQIILTVEMPENCCVADLVSGVKQRLYQKRVPIHNMVCLQSVDNQEVLDYSLLIDQYPLSNYANLVRLQIVYKENVRSRSQISLNDFHFKKCIGKGSSATVILVRHKQTGYLFALKQISKKYFTEFKRLELVLRQKKIMVQFLRDSAFTSKLVATFQSENHLNFLLEFYPGGELFFHLQSQRLNQDEARNYFAELTIAFEYLHSRNIIYRDLKPENIMIDINGHIRLTDFGLCKICSSREDITTSYCGSIQYMAPQVKQCSGYSFSADFFTLGAILYELVMGIPPYYNTSKLYFLEDSSQPYRNLVRGLIQPDLQKRILTFSKLKQSEFMKEYNWRSVEKQKLEMAFKVNPHATYIHKEFKEIQIKQMNQEHLERFDRLFDFFTYLNSKNQKFCRSYDLKSKESAPVSERPSTPLNYSGDKKMKLLSKKQKNSSKSSRNSSKNKQNKFSVYMTKNAVDKKVEKNLSPNGFKMKPLSQTKSANELMKYDIGKI